MAESYNGSQGSIVLAILSGTDTTIDGSVVTWSLQKTRPSWQVRTKGQSFGETQTGVGFWVLSIQFKIPKNKVQDDISLLNKDFKHIQLLPDDNTANEYWEAGSTSGTDSVARVTQESVSSPENNYLSYTLRIEQVEEDLEWKLT